MNKEHPILFKTEMVQAILDGRKIQTRRVIDKLYPISNPNGNWLYIGHKDSGYVFKDSISSTIPLKYPYGQVGDRLWIKETYCSCVEPPNKDMGVCYKTNLREQSAADFCTDKNIKWKPLIFMPRWASRITLEITDIKPQKLQDITNDEAFLEGMSKNIAAKLGYSTSESEEEFNFTQTRYIFSKYWDSINSKHGYGWDENPYVWVISFKVIKNGA